jgi:hypothetical protein
MNRERIAKMTDSIVGVVTAEEVDNIHVAAVAGDEDALAMVDQALDSAVASLQVISEYLPKVKIGSVPQKAAVDAIQDLMETALRPYLADVIMAMRVFEE